MSNIMHHIDYMCDFICIKKEKSSNSMSSNFAMDHAWMHIYANQVLN